MGQRPMSTSRKSRAFFMIYGYARVSTTDQDTALQIEALRAAGAEHIFHEKRSGADRNRAQLRHLLRKIKRGDVLLVYKIDRLARSLIDLLRIVETLSDKGSMLKSLTEPISHDTASGRALLGMLAVFAEFERNMIIERSQAGQKLAMQNGVHCGRQPGYTEDQHRQVFVLTSQGYKGREIASRLDLSESQVKRIRHGYNKSYATKSRLT